MGQWAPFCQLTGPWAISWVQIHNTYIIGLNEHFYEEKKYFHVHKLGQNAPKPFLGLLRPKMGTLGTFLKNRSAPTYSAWNSTLESVFKKKMNTLSHWLSVLSPTISISILSLYWTCFKVYINLLWVSICQRFFFITEKISFENENT